MATQIQFAPGEAVIGGLFIGTACGVLMLTSGKVAGLWFFFFFFFFHHTLPQRIDFLFFISPKKKKQRKLWSFKICCHWTF